MTFNKKQLFAESKTIDETTQFGRLYTNYFKTKL